jgi:hypothetical protein
MNVQTVQKVVLLKCSKKCPKKWSKKVENSWKRSKKSHMEVAWRGLPKWMLFYKFLSEMGFLAASAARPALMIALLFLLFLFSIL